jgi:tetratricopeptide (TPR) repeat protein
MEGLMSETDQTAANEPERKPLGKAESAGLIGLVIGLLLGIAVGYFVWGSDSSPSDPSGQSSGEPITAEGLVTEGLRLQTAGQSDQAKAKYSEALGLDASNKYALYNLGLIEQTAGNPAGSIPLYRRALATDPAFNSARYNLGLALRDTGDSSGAIAELEAVLATDPDGIGTLVNLGNLLVEAGDRTRGQELLDRAAELRSDTP